MPVTTSLLARLRSLDDLLELVSTLGYVPSGDELGPAARARLGLGSESLAVHRAAVLARCGTYPVYGAVLDHAEPHLVAAASERLARAGTGERHLLLALDRRGTTLAVAAAAPENTASRARQLRIQLDRPSAVAAEILGGLAPRAGDTPVSLSLRIADALAGEGITARFFREFSRHHAAAAAALTGMPRATDLERRDLALVMLTRVLFLYFVQAKGWLAGRTDFLPSLLDTALRTGQSFHRSAFEPLCFGALSAPPGARRAAARSLGDVPFLNGGLFERHALERRFPDAALPDETWRALFDDLFQRFHFTVHEHDDDAIDPEMLGRVFEGLMAADRRRHSGTYFTPRDLLRRTVAGALSASLEGRPRDAVLSLRVLDPAAGSGAFLLEALSQLEPLRAAVLPGESAGQRRRAVIRDNLFGVDLDPRAVRLAELRLWLALVADESADCRDITPLPNLDLNLRQGDSLLSPLDFAEGTRAPGTSERIRAVAERRTEYFAATGRRKSVLARAIRAQERAIADEGAGAAIATLTARLADVSAQGRDLFGRRAAREPSVVRRIGEWRRRRRELLAMRRRLAEDDTVPFFAWDTHFGDIMASGGFDVVLGNPPWVRGERLPLSTRGVLAARYRTFRPTAPGKRGFAHLPDLSVAFVECALRLMRDGAVCGLILPAKLLRAGYAGPLRALLRERATILSLEDRSHAVGRDFAATVFPMVCVVRKQAPEPSGAVRISIAGERAANGLTTQQDLPLDDENPRSIWLALPGAQARAVRAALSAGPRLSSRFRPRLGVKTGANDAFVRDADQAGDLPATHRAPALLGRDIGPFVARPSAIMLAALGPGGQPCRAVSADVLEFLRPHAGRLAGRADGRGAPAWALFRTDLLRGRWLVLWRDIAPRLEAVALERAALDAPIPLNTCYGVVVPDAFTADWLAAWLNSTAIRALAAALAERASGGAFRFSAGTVGMLPLPDDTGTATVRSLAALGRTARLGEEWNPDDLDSLVTRALALEPGTSAALHAIAPAVR